MTLVSVTQTKTHYIPVRTESLLCQACYLIISTMSLVKQNAKERFHIPQDFLSSPISTFRLPIFLAEVCWVSPSTFFFFLQILPSSMLSSSKPVLCHHFPAFPGKIQQKLFTLCCRHFPTDRYTSFHLVIHNRHNVGYESATTILGPENF